MNDIEKTRIAAAINQLRPDWPIPSIRTLLDRPALSNRHRRDVAVALTWVACEADTKTPARVIEAGPWWQAAAIDGPGIAPTREPYDPATHCDTCGTPEARHRATDHEFASVLEVRRRTTDAPKPPIRELIAAVTEETTP